LPALLLETPHPSNPSLPSCPPALSWHHLPPIRCYTFIVQRNPRNSKTLSVRKRLKHGIITGKFGFNFQKGDYPKWVFYFLANIAHIPNIDNKFDMCHMPNINVSPGFGLKPE
jgi:hypothetical protein